MTDTPTINFGHSPDADDAFMFYGFASGAVSIPGHQVGHTILDIQTLNNLADKGDIDVTAISAAHYPEVCHNYRIMSAGASVGRNYGPVVVAKRRLEPADLASCVIGCPGNKTTSWMLYRSLGYEHGQVKFLNFDELDGALERGEVDAAIMLHERQITFQRDGLLEVANLGRHWFEETGLPIPLGLDVISRKLPEETMQSVADAFKTSIKHGLDNEDAALDYALKYGRGLSREDGRRFIGMYVNGDTFEMGSDVVEALETLYEKAHIAKLIKAVPKLDVIKAKVQSEAVP